MKTTLTVLAMTATCCLQAQQSQSSLLGKIDFYDLLESVPELQPTTQDAYAFTCNKNINCEGESQLENQFETFKQKLEIYSNQLAEAMEANVNNLYGTTDQEALYAQTVNEVNQNAIIAQMGGIDKISQMSESEREEAAKRAVASMTTSTSLSPFTEAETQRMMNDPEYAQQMAAKYNNMTEAEKEQMVRQKLAKKNVKVTQKDRDKALAKSKEIENSIAINHYISETTTKITEVFTAYSTTIQNLRTVAKGNHQELERAYKEQYDQIPLVVMGEGKIPDPEKARSLKMEYALKHKVRAAMELSSVLVEYQNLNKQVTGIIKDYYAFVKMNGSTDAQTELSLAQFEGSLGEFINRMAEFSYTENALASEFEQYYQYVSTEI